MGTHRYVRPGSALVPKPQVHRCQPLTLVPLLPAPEAVDLGLIPSSANFMLCDPGHVAQLSGPLLPHL